MQQEKTYGCESLKEVILPKDFGLRRGWHNALGLKNRVINDTQINVDYDDNLIYENVKCIACHDNGYYREKQIFPERMEYLKNPKLLSHARVNVFKNDTFDIIEDEKVFYEYSFNPFRIKAEIAYMRCKSGYRLSEKAKDNYKEYLRYHRKKLDKLLEKDQYRELKEFFASL